MTQPTSHLGERVSAFIDGELDHEARERVLVHLARCAGCRLIVDAERQTKRLLSTAGGPDLPPGLTDKLTRVATTTHRPRHAVRVRGRSRPRVHRRRRVAATSGAVLVGALSLAFVVGGGPVEGSPVTPNVGRFTVEHGVVSDEVVPLSDSGGSAVVVSFTTPTIP